MEKMSFEAQLREGAGLLHLSILHPGFFRQNNAQGSQTGVPMYSCPTLNQSGIHRLADSRDHPSNDKVWSIAFDLVPVKAELEGDHGMSSDPATYDPA